jgi:hypothetical protein
MHVSAPKEVGLALAFIFVAGCVIAVFSVGIFYLPSALLSLVAVAFDRRPRKPPQTA